MNLKPIFNLLKKCIKVKRAQNGSQNRKTYFINDETNTHPYSETYEMCS
jgi:hypothetical protein